MTWIRITPLLVAGIAAIGCGSPAPQSAPAETSNAATAAPPTEAKSLSFAADVKPLLTTHCAECHMDGSTKGGYSLDTHESAVQEGGKGPRIVAGNSAGSNLVQRIKGEPGVKKMPPKGDMMSAADAAIIAAWIDQGATAP